MQADQVHIKNIIHHDQVDFITVMQEWFGICKSMTIRNHIITSIDAETVLTKNPAPLYDKSPINRLGMGKIYHHT